MTRIKNAHLNKSTSLSPMWEYKRFDGKQEITIYNVKENLYVVESKGIAFQEGCSLAFEVIIDTVRNTGRRICCLLDNTRLISIDWSFKHLFLKFPLANECFAKIATYGNNMYVRSFGRIYQHTFGRKFQIRSFNDKEAALAWLEKG